MCFKPLKEIYVKKKDVLIKVPAFLKGMLITNYLWRTSFRLLFLIEKWQNYSYFGQTLKYYYAQSHIIFGGVTLIEHVNNYQVLAKQILAKCL